MNKVHQQKYVSKYTKISKIGALVRSFIQPDSTAMGFSIKDPSVRLDGTRPQVC